MAYEGFTLKLLIERFGLNITQVNQLFADVSPISPSDLLVAVLDRGLPLVISKGTEKARSEHVIAPILLEVREILERNIAVFSGVAFNVDRKLGLHGFCDFLISQNPLLIEIDAPVVMLVEAKREDVSGGIAQCIAEMVAAQRFNVTQGRPKEKIFGAVTSGTDWRFLELQGTDVRLDLRDYSIQELPAILGVLTYMARAV
jgi:AcrR family transcriptional regulator